jgi:hypothetical protein
MAYRLFSVLLKILLASLLVGVALSSLNITAAQVLQDFGLTPEHILNYARRGVHWALPHIILGALITVPIWLVMYLLRPPRGD